MLNLPPLSGLETGSNFREAPGGVLISVSFLDWTVWQCLSMFLLEVEPNSGFV